MTVVPHPDNPDELRRQIKEEEQRAFMWAMAFRFSAAPPATRAAIEKFAAAVGLPAELYAPIFADQAVKVAEARIGYLRDRLDRIEARGLRS